MESAVVAVAGTRAADGGFVLESTAPHQAFGRYTILGCNPVEVFTVDTAGCHADACASVLRSKQGSVATAPSGWLERLAARVGSGDPRFAHSELPFVGGWVGFISYEAGHLLDTVGIVRSLEMVGTAHPTYQMGQADHAERAGGEKANDIALPLVRFALYDTVAVYDLQDQCWFLAAIDWPGEYPTHRAPAQQRLDELEDLLVTASDARPINWSKALAGEPTSSMSPADYHQRVARAKRHIEDGDIYQVNLTQRFSAVTSASPLDVYRRLRVSNPGALSALLMVGKSAIISSSPELFLDLSGRDITTRPIKGTRPRVGDEVLDAIRSRELVDSEKDRAELTMIVDLMRNDLGRVSEFGTVRVVPPGDLETHPTVYHLVATITSRLREGLGWADLLRASFPGGSITGAPKIRSMQIIHELEATPRSVYCGSIGFIGLDGSMRLNIAIRTMILDRGWIHLFSGGAIVADSDPIDEYEETLAKAAGMMGALRAGEPCQTSSLPRARGYHRSGDRPARNPSLALGGRWSGAIHDE